jgi:hypothetical protein
MQLLLLPPELKRLIVELCSGSPSSLAALARTHSAYQGEAEEALYETLHIFASSDSSMKCMKTLDANPKKAALVRFLTITYSPYNNEENWRLTTYLSKSLINMHTLTDLRMKSWPGERISKILW